MKFALYSKFLLLTTLLFTVACTSVFYQPSRHAIFKITNPEILYNDVYISTKDHLKLHGWHFPAQKKGKKVESKGVVLFFHGNAQNITSHAFSLHWLIEESYDYVLFDYRGYGASEGSIDNDLILHDIEAMYHYAKDYADSIKAPLILYGQSLGGTLLLKYLSSRNVQDYDDLVIEGSFYAFQEIAERKAEQIWFLWPFQWLIPVLISDRNSLETNELQQLLKPKVVMHSEVDPVVPFSQGKKIFENLSEPKEFWIYPNKTHTGGSRINDGEYAKRLLRRWQSN